MAPNPVRGIMSYLRGEDFQAPAAIQDASVADDLVRTAAERGLQEKFTPASPDADWPRIQQLVMTANTVSPSRGGDFNSAVFSCLLQLSLGAIEPPLRLYRESAVNKREPVLDHPIYSLLRKPNTFHRARDLWFWVTWALHCDGNAYFLKLRSGHPLTGNVVELWPLSPSICRPYTAKDSSNYIDGYKWWRTPDDEVTEPAQNIIHFRLGVDDRDHRLGLAPIKRLVREVASDDAATRWTDRMLAVGGAASMLVTVPKDTTLTSDQAEEMRQRIEERFTGERVGSVGVLGGGATASRYGFSPQEMDLSSLHNVPETRVCAVIGVHPAVAMLGSGLSQTANYASLREIYIAFTERKLAPLWVSYEDALNSDLLPDFTRQANMLLAFDLSQVRALQENADALWQRVTNAWDKNLLTLDQSLNLIGLEAVGGEEGGKRKNELGAAMASSLFGQQQPGAPGTGPNDQNQGQNQGQGATDSGGGKTTPPKKGAFTRKDAHAVDNWPELMDALINLSEPAFEDDMKAYFDDQRRRVKRTVIGRSP
jgi:HK97 family phage portal protein